MAEAFFLDTNIFVYAATDDDPAKASVASSLVRRALSTHKGVVSFQVVQEFFNVAFKRFAPRMSPAESEAYIDGVFLPMLRIHSSASLYIEALALYRKHSLAWYDSLIVSAALQAECAILYSEDMQHGQRFGALQVRNPFL